MKASPDRTQWRRINTWLADLIHSRLVPADDDEPRLNFIGSAPHDGHLALQRLPGFPDKFSIVKKTDFRFFGVADFNFNLALGVQPESGLLAGKDAHALAIDLPVILPAELWAKLFAQLWTHRLPLRIGRHLLIAASDELCVEGLCLVFRQASCMDSEQQEEADDCFHKVRCRILDSLTPPMSREFNKH